MSQKAYKIIVKDREGNVTEAEFAVHVRNILDPQNLPEGNDAGINPYEYAQAGGYQGTEDEFKQLLANAVTKATVEDMIAQAKAELFMSAAKIACLVTIDAVGHEHRHNQKLTPVSLANEDYSLTCNGTIPADSGQYIRLEPPPGYAFTGLAYTWVPALKIGETFRIGTLEADGVITFTLNPSDVGQSFDFVSMGNGSTPPARFILEVA